MTAIRFFEMLGRVIERNIHTIAQQRGLTDDQAYQQVIAHIADNSKEWRSGRQPAIPYHDPLCRIAYLYAITAANAALVKKAFEQSGELVEYFDAVLAEKGDVSICAFGGGPGTELLGVAKWLEERMLEEELEEDSVDLQFLLLDKQNHWVESWRAITREISSELREQYGRNKVPVRVSGSFSAVDITDPTALTDLGTLFQQDIFILSYVVSEVFENVAALRNFTAQMAQNAPGGSKFLFIDRDEERWRDEVRRIAQDAGLYLGEFTRSNTNMSHDEQATDLGRVYEDVKRLGGWNPRVRWTAFWVVGTKQ